MKRALISGLAAVLIFALITGAWADSGSDALVFNAELADEEAVEIDSPLFSEEMILETADMPGEIQSNDSNEDLDEGVVIDEFAFPDAAFREYVRESFDTNGDDWLSEEELERVTEIYVEEKGISSLSGLDYFVNLEELDCSENDLTELDVSENTKLTELRCEGNEIAKLDLSGNKALEVLDCSENMLTSLNTKQCKKIRVINVEKNRLTKLDVSKNTGLLEMDCSNNKLKKLIIGKNKKLRALECFGNSGLKEIDLGGCNTLKKYPECVLYIYEDSASCGWMLGEEDYILMDRTIKLYDGKKLLYKPGKPKSVAFKKKSVTLKKGKEARLTLTMKPAGVASVCTFTSSKPGRVGVDEYGYIYAKKKGSATITVKTANGKKAKIKVTVK